MNYFIHEFAYGENNVLRKIRARLDEQSADIRLLASTDFPGYVNKQTIAPSSKRGARCFA